METHEEYTFPQCHQYNKNTEPEYEHYSVTCDNGVASYHPLDTNFLGRISGLEQPAKSLLISRENQRFFSELKAYILQKLQKNYTENDDLIQCFVFNMNNPNSVTEACRAQIDLMRTNSRGAYPLLRKNMALMEGIDSDGDIDPEIEHPHQIHETPKLTFDEEKQIEDELKEVLRNKSESYTTEFNQRYNCPSPERLRENPNLRPTRFCRQRISGHRARAMESFRDKLKERAADNYRTILSEAPYLAFFDVPKLGVTPTAVDTQIMGALQTMRNHALDEYEKWEKKPIRDFKEFFKYPSIIQDFISHRGGSPSEFGCDLVETLNDKFGPGGSEELAQTIGIATAALVGGGLCAMTAGLGCAIAVAVGTEALAIGNSQMNLEQAIQLNRSGMVSNERVIEAQSDRDLDLFLAPLSFVGLKAGRTVAAATKTTTRLGRREFLETFVSFNPTRASDNALWMTRARSNNNGFFFDVENAALKRLNDSLGDKNLVTALTNLHKEILFRRIDDLALKYPQLKVYKYSDFKSSRFSFEGDLPPELQTELRQLFQETNREFAQRISHMPDLNLPDTENPAAWFNAGLGRSADHAGLAARHARQIPRGDVQMVDIEKVREQLQQSMVEIEGQRSLAVRSLRNSPHLLEGPAGSQIPSTEVFEVLRKSKGKSPEELAELFKTRFNVDLTPDEAHNLLKYNDEVDAFSPGIWIEERVVANLDEAEHGGFSVDFKGMGARNVSQVARDLADNGTNIDDAIRAIREGEGAVTQQFDQAKDGFKELVEETLSDLNIPVKTNCSGDDCVSIPTAVLPDIAKEKMMAAIARTDNPSGYRLSFIPPGISQADRSIIAVHGELVEKNVRKKLTGFGEGLIPPSVLDRVTFALDMPRTKGTGGVRLLVKAEDGVSLTPEQRRLIESNLPKAISSVNEEIAKETGNSINYLDGGVQFFQPN